MYYMKQSLIEKKEHFRFAAFEGLSANMCTCETAHEIRSHRPYSLTRNNSVLNIFTTPYTEPSTLYPCESFTQKKLKTHL